MGYLLAITFLLQAALPLAGPQPAKATVKGVVREARTGDPIAGARVTLTSSAATPPSPRETISPVAAVSTGHDGTFLMTDIEPGNYRFSAGNNGYVRYESTLALAAGQIKDDIAVEMTRTATISGHIGSTTGKPVAGVSVALQRRIYNASGAVSFSTVATVQTNDLGDYRAYWVPPGRYYISAVGGGSVLFMDAGAIFDQAANRGNNAVSETYPRAFFPGVADPSKAIAVELVEGADVRGIDFTMPRQQRQHSIRGRVIDSSTGQAPPKATISISPGGSAVRWYDAAKGTFEIPNLVPGSYAVTGRPGDNVNIIGLAGGQTVGQPQASMVVTIVDSDVENLTLTIAPTASISGRIHVEGQLPSTTPMERLRVSLAPMPTNPVSSTSSAAVAADGSFQMNAPIDGAYRPTVSSLPAGFYVKEARFNNTNVLDTPARFSTSGSMDILISANSGLVSGPVLNEQSKPVAGILVVLIPNNSRDRPDLYRTARSDPQGRFTLIGIAPGDYKVFAWERLEANSYYDPDVLGKYEQRGAPVRIAEGSRDTTEVRLIPEGAAP